MPAAPPIVRFVTTELSKHADPQKARDQAAYMKTQQPFFGVMQAIRVPVMREACTRFPPANFAEYKRNVLALWNAGQAKGGQRDLQYAAIFYLARFKKYHTPAVLPLCKKMVEQGAWWDLVDWIATKVVSPVVDAHRKQAAPVMRKWIEDPHLWVRRTAILCQLSNKREADVDMLFAFCLARADEKDFFIRKAIGWALRDHSKTRPAEVRAFLVKNKACFSNLSVREGGKYIGVAPSVSRITSPASNGRVQTRSRRATAARTTKAVRP